MFRKQPSGARDMPNRGSRPIHLISDSTGETLQAVIRAGLASFAQVESHLVVSVFVRSPTDLAEATAQVERNPGLVVYTLANEELREQLLNFCKEQDVTALAVIDPLTKALSEYFGTPAVQRPGLQHRMTTDYFDRIAALDYAIAHDDGSLGKRLLKADVILTGVSRTSKTPTCIYLAYRGIKAANVPLVPRTQPSAEFLHAMNEKIPVIGLTASPSRLAQIRTQRLEVLGAAASADYAELERIRTEVADARLFFDKYELPVIDVTRRSIEETAAEILVILRDRGALDE